MKLEYPIFVVAPEEVDGVYLDLARDLVKEYPDTFAGMTLEQSADLIRKDEYIEIPNADGTIAIWIKE